MNARRFVFAALMAVLSFAAFADELPVEVESEDLPDSAQVGSVEVPKLDTEAAASCVSMSASITNGGHRWNINARNSCGRRLNCQVSLNLRTKAGGVTAANCNPTVLPGNSLVCYSTNSTVTWVSVINGSFRCS